ncbi:hypothetical protein HNV08_02725 [Winogradskyella eckloniae]|uniref:hypothetical protein n=1 Tax=Winogradskyella eckloniae TaxID=1089306 RepID=UPI0015668824|nr:hypothetical protein [Winogradskyella eckloniae]NRD18948.1 hypothetical protein [Winogradskyella eckloniae]
MKVCIYAIAFLFMVSLNAQDAVDFTKKGRDWYVSKSTGSGKLGTKEQPAKDLGNIIYLLKPNDIIHIAEGVYMSKGKRGSDEINVPVQIYGGYDVTFTKRAPWTDHKTIFTGTNDYKKLTTPRLYIRTDQQRSKNGQLAEGGLIVVDGIIVDNGPRNRYHHDKDLAIRRKASPKSQQNPSPESGGIVVVASHYMNVGVQNCVVMNTAPTEGAISVRVKKGGKGYIRNNLSINNTGYGIHARTGYVGNDPKLVPQFVISNNTSLFNWKHDPVASYGGNALALDKELTATITNNVFGFGHFGGIYNKGANIVLSNNLFTGNSKYDYKEINDEMIVDDIVDEAERIDASSTGNSTALLQISVAERWAKIYGNRKELSREAVDASVSAANSGANQLRGMLGLNLQGNTTTMDAEIFLPRLQIEEAIPVGLKNWNGIGCATPRYQ